MCSNCFKGNRIFQELLQKTIYLIQEVSCNTHISWFVTWNYVDSFYSQYQIFDVVAAAKLNNIKNINQRFDLLHLTQHFI